jgi:hypothetical protein
VVERLHGGALTPVPLKLTDCVVGFALSVKTRVADLLPKAVGAKLASTVQLAETASVPGQLFICVNEVGLVPPSAIEVRVRAPVPEFVRVMAWAGLDA